MEVSLEVQKRTELFVFWPTTIKFRFFKSKRNA